MQVLLAPTDTPAFVGLLAIFADSGSIQALIVDVLELGCCRLRNHRRDRLANVPGQLRRVVDPPPVRRFNGGQKVNFLAITALLAVLPKRATS